jgi:hypothetical protein
VREREFAYVSIFIPICIYIYICRRLFLLIPIPALSHTKTYTIPERGRRRPTTVGKTQKTPEELIKRKTQKKTQKTPEELIKETCYNCK